MSNSEMEKNFTADQQQIQAIYKEVHDLITSKGWSFRHTFQALALLLVDGGVLVGLPLADLHQFIEQSYEFVKARAEASKVKL